MKHVSLLDEKIDGTILTTKETTHYYSRITKGIIPCDIFQRSLFGKPVEKLMELFDLQPKTTIISTILF
jgi:hypothetical protein